MRLIGRIFAFIIAAAVTLAFEWILVLMLDGLTGLNMIPRGFGWFWLPVAAGVVGSRALPTLGSNPAARICCAVLASWWIAVLVYAIVAEPFGYSYSFATMFSNNIGAILQWMLLPPIVLVGLLFLFLCAVGILARQPPGHVQSNRQP